MRTPISTALHQLLLGSAVVLGTLTLPRHVLAQELRDQWHQAPRDTVSQDTYDGWKQFNLNCARCHGEDALGTSFAPHLIVSLKPDGPIPTKELFMQTVCAGRPAKGMPSWCALGMELPTIEKIYSYVKARSDAKLAPGRPAVKREG
jgi:mono/diheme cytochrome c family protein